MCAACDVINRDEKDIENFVESMDGINEFTNEIFPSSCEKPNSIGQQDFVN